jgi:hypothetical protein
MAVRSNGRMRMAVANLAGNASEYGRPKFVMQQRTATGKLTRPGWPRIRFYSMLSAPLRKSSASAGLVDTSDSAEASLLSFMIGIVGTVAHAVDIRMLPSEHAAFI